MSGRVTIEDLAAKLGLSKFSVSRALSGKSGVAEATRARVLRAAHVMGYRLRSEGGRSLGQILFVRQEIDPVSSELWLNMLHGAEEEAERLGFAIVPRQARYLVDAAALDPAVVGMILAVPRPGDVLDYATRTGLPIVCASYVSPLSRVDQVVGADWEAGVAVARMLTGLGHRATAFVHVSTLPLGRAERWRGFRDGMLETPGAIVEDLVFDEVAGFRGAFLGFLEAGNLPTALFCAHDGIAVNAVSELSRLGLRVPEDISVVGFNDFAAAIQVSPRLTTVRTPQVEMGGAMVRCIADRLANQTRGLGAPQRIALVAEIVRRESTAAASEPLWVARILRGERAA
ncbi:MAG: hypothetical protein JWR75_789 [Devosia sp.]|nr:hypothetical protein [Devosia sp.]